MKSEKLVPSNTAHDTFVKNVALSAAFSESKLTLRKSKALHVLAFTVREQFFARNPQFNASNIHQVTIGDLDSRRLFRIGESQVMEAMGYVDKRKYYSINQVLEIFEELSDEKIYLDALGIVQSKTESKNPIGFTRVLGSAIRDNGAFVFDVPALMVLFLVHPEVSFNAPVSWNTYSNKYAPSIYETCLYYFQNGESHTDYFSLEALRKMTDTSNAPTYDKFDNFKKRVIEKTLSSINVPDNDLQLHINYEAVTLNLERKRGRQPITHVRFVFHEKTALQSKKPQVHEVVSLSILEQEIESFGVPRHAISDVIDECRDGQGNVSLPFIRFTVKKANELRTMQKFISNNDTKKNNNFGGYYRKHIVRARREEFFQVFDVLIAALREKHGKSLSIHDAEFDEKLDALQVELQKRIALQFVKKLSAEAFTFLADKFREHLEVEKPDIYRRYVDGEFGPSLIEMAQDGNAHLIAFLDYSQKIFSKEQYQSVL